MAVFTPIDLGQDEGYSDAGVIGLTDPFPTQKLTGPAVRRLTETRLVALADPTQVAKIQDIGVPTWNDVVFAHRSVYAKTGALGVLPPNLLFAYSPAAKLGYTLNVSGVQNASDTDVTGKTITFPNSTIFDMARVAVAATVSTAPLAAGTLDNLMAIFSHHGEPLSTAPRVYLRYTDANNWIRFFRQANTTIRIEKNVASVTTTERDTTVPSTEPWSGSALAIRINGTLCRVYLNGTLYDSFTLSAGAQGLTGLLIGYEISVPTRTAMGEWEVWSTLPPYQSK